MLPPMSNDRCPSCGQSATTSTEPGRGKCAACGAKFFKYPEILPALAGLGIDGNVIQQTVQRQALETLTDPSTGAMLKTINLQGLTLHLSPAGQAIWLSAEDCQRVGLQPAPVTTLGAAEFKGPSSGDDVMAALGLGGGPAAAAPAPSGGGGELDLDMGSRTARPKAPSLDAESAALFDDMPQQPLPQEIREAGPVVSESAFANKPPRMSGAGGLIGGLIKLAVLGGLVAGGWFGYEEVRSRMVWPEVAIAWGYTATFPSKPKPVADTVDTSRGVFDRLLWEGDDGLKLEALWLDVGFGHEETAREVIAEVAGKHFIVEPATPTKNGPKAFRFHAITGDTVGEGRSYFDDNGHVIVLLGTGPDRAVTGDAEAFAHSLTRKAAGDEPADE